MRESPGIAAAATFIVSALLVSACTGSRTSSTAVNAGAFAEDVAFLRHHTEIVVLGEPAGSQVVVAPAYQGRVMTSTTGGADGPSFGWIGRSAIASGRRQPHMNVFGGEDRFWLGPEGGQFALYFKQGDPFDVDHWEVPEAFDWGAWAMDARSPSSVQFHKRMTLANYSGASFDVDVERTVRLLTPEETAPLVGTAVTAPVRMVAFESSNTIRNAGDSGWQTGSGLISVWILGQFTPSGKTTIVLPIAGGDPAAAGPAVNDAYFGKVPDSRLRVTDRAVFFKGDGQYRSKIGLSPLRALPLAGSYDAGSRVLTLVQYTRPSNAREYVNSMWEIQREPYQGDAVNSYNDGPTAPGKPPLGPFYELETSSPALALAPGGRYTHVHRTFHFSGPDADLDRIARATLKVGLADIEDAFRSR